MKLLGSVFITISLAGSISFSQISIDGVGNYIQNFDSLTFTGTSSTLPFGWEFTESGTNANTLYTAGTGSSTTGDTYSFGSASSTERALGGLRSGTLIPIIGVQFRNNTGSTITQLPISYTGEQWRLGTRNRFDRLDFQYSLDATSLSTGIWTDVDNLDFITADTSGTVGARDGNLVSYRTSISFTITGLSISDGAVFWIRWMDSDASGSDDGLAIDDFSIDEANLPVEISSFSAIVLDNAVKLNWNTETEVNNYGFEVQKSEDGGQESEWNAIGFVEGHGNSNSPKDYSFVDENVVGGKYSYRLKQIDTDGQFEYSKIIEVDLGSPAKFELSQNYPNPFNPGTTIKFSIPQSSNVTLKIFNTLGQEVSTLIKQNMEAGVHTINFDASHLNSGIYFYRIDAGQFNEVRKMTLIK